MVDRFARAGRSGLTPAELLAAIALAAVVGAVLGAASAQARQQARRASCVSNLKQIGTAAQLYLQDYDETWVPWGGFAASPDWSFVRRLDPYIKLQGATDSVDRGVWRCPAGVGFETGGVVNTYGYNYLRLGFTYIGSDAYLAAGRKPAVRSAIERPEEMIAFLDGIDLVSPPYGVQVNGYPRCVGAWHGAAHGVTVTSVGVARADPRAQVVVSWADGHVKAMKRSAVTAPVDNGGMARNDNLWDRRNPSPWSF